MNTPRLRFTLYTIIVSLTLSTLTPTIAAAHPPAGNGAHFGGDITDDLSDKQYSDQFSNRHYTRASAANLDVGEPRTVRLIYFLPNNRPYQADVVERLKTDIRFVQDFYAQEIQARGYGDTTFRVETDPQGEPMVHRVDGSHPDSHYSNSTYEIVIDEIATTFDLNMNIYLVVADDSIRVVGRGSRWGKNGGFALVLERFDWKLVAHELGHAFGLHHDFNDDAYIMSYGYQTQLSACSAEYLSVHPYFNPNVQPEDTRPTIELISPRIYPAEAKNVPIKLKVSDSEGLHQVILLAASVGWLQGYSEVKACQGLGGVTDTVVEFDYDGVIPSDDIVSLSFPTQHPIIIQAVDVNGNTRQYSFNLESDSPESYIVDSYFDIYLDIELRGRSVTAVFAEFPDLVHLPGIGFTTQNIRDVVEIVSALSGMPNLKRLDLAVNSISDISPIASLTNLTYLDLDSNSISDISPILRLPNLTHLFLSNNPISDLSPISGLPNLTRLSLSYNDISDISALGGLNRLAELNLRDNSVSDISVLAGLTNLTELWLNGNNISDISALGSLNRLAELSLRRNNISDLSALAGLPRLGDLRVGGNPLSYTSIYTHIPALQARGVQVEFDERTPWRVMKISGDQHSAPATSLPIIVEVQDNSGYRFEGVPVIFTLTAGSGTLSTTAATTDRNGQAESTLTLGADVGTRTVEVSVAEIEQPLIFTIEGKEGTIIPDSNLRAKIGAALGKGSGDPISPSEIAKLTYLNAFNADISNLTGLEGATNLTVLWLNVNNISDISAVSGLSNLTELRLGDNNISDISGISGLSNLTELRLGDNNISDISGISGLSNLTELWLGRNSISAISAVSGLTNLTELYLYDNDISAISAVSGLTNLTVLNLGGNNISDISAVSGLTNLTVLGLGGNSISDISAVISAVAGLTNLTVLGLGDNNISDISGISSLTNLTGLWLHGNSISDLSPLVASKGLGPGDKVDVRDNPLSYTAIHTHIPILQSRGVEVYFDTQVQPALLKISGDNQTGPPAAALANPFVVEVQHSDGTGLAGISVTFAVTAGDGTLSALHTTTDANGRAESTLTLGPHLGTNTVSASVNEFIWFPEPGGATGYKVDWQVTFQATADTESSPIAADVNGDGVVNILDLVSVAASLESETPNLTADVNGDGVVNILDVVLVAGLLESTASAPAARPRVPETLTAVEVQAWLTDAISLEVTDVIMKRGVAVLGQLLAALTPAVTELLPNYPNPFNPETWIPYRLAEDAFVTLTIYDTGGQVVRALEVGHRIASAYETRSKAIYWDGRNGLGEQVASGVYFYHLSAGDYAATRRMVILK